MYEYMKGKIILVTENYIILEVGNIAYRIYVTRNSFKLNSCVLLYIYYYCSENIKQLYGFKQKIEREVFQKLINLKSIGIKTAFNILKNDSYETILAAVYNMNYDFLLSLNKINEKNVDSLIKEIKSIKYKDNFSIDNQFYVSLKSLDYNDSDIYKSYKLINKDQPINLMIKEAIKIIESGGLNE